MHFLMKEKVERQLTTSISTLGEQQMQKKKKKENHIPTYRNTGKYVFLHVNSKFTVLSYNVGMGYQYFRIPPNYKSIK